MLSSIKVKITNVLKFIKEKLSWIYVGTNYNFRHILPIRSAETYQAQRLLKFLNNNDAISYENSELTFIKGSIEAVVLPYESSDGSIIYIFSVRIHNHHHFFENILINSEDISPELNHAINTMLEIHINKVTTKYIKHDLSDVNISNAES